MKITDGRRSLNTELEAKARAIAGIKDYITTGSTSPPSRSSPPTTIRHVEKAFRVSKHDLRAGPIYHRKHESIDAHLTVVIAAIAVAHFIETETKWSIKKFVRTARRYRTIEIQAGAQTITAEVPMPTDFAQALNAITAAANRH